MSAALQIIVLAAGEGKRMRSAVPKVLQRIAEKSMLEHVLETARTLNPQGIHLVYGHGADQVKAAITPSADLVWVQQTQQLGTGHAVLQALPSIADDALVLVLFADAPLITAATLNTLIASTQLTQPSLLADEVNNPFGYGRVLCNEAGQVQAVIEERDATINQRAIRLINTGVMAAYAKQLKSWLSRVENRNAQGEYYLTDIFSLAAQEKTPALCVRCQESGEADGANDFWQLAQLERRLQTRRAKALALNGVRLADPNRVDIRGDVDAAQGVEVDVDVIFEGKVILGKNVRVGPYTRLRNVELGENTVVHAHCDLEGVVDEGHSRIGPYARLRPGTHLKPNVHIGNFVEVKKTQIGYGSKANHLSYLGDALIGSEVNIGAGTITCNYDGVDKHITKIDGHAFIGSNTSLVAPVHIGDHATVGAGSVITQNVPSAHLTIARAEQKNISDWKRPRGKK